MKKTLALLLVLCLMLSACGTVNDVTTVAPQTTTAQDTSKESTPAAETTAAPAETTAPGTDAPTTEEPTKPDEPGPGPETKALPEVGDQVYGFTVKEIHAFPMLGAQIFRFEHDRTGAELFYIVNEDTNRIFDLTFFTETLDNTGVPHVFEHSTLDGSQKYPSKSLFFNLVYQTYNTYMNAQTSKKMTTYPVASLSEEQLLKYADLYIDSCFYPMIMEDESIFREEAWRYRLDDADAPLTIEGTVYSEMLGATTLSRVANINFLRTTFPGSRVGNDHGGDPAVIPEMTWEMLKDYHDTYYHPSNCAAYLYGAFDNYEAFLELLDKAFEPFEKKEFAREDPDYTPLTESVEVELPFAVEESSNTEHASHCYYAILCPGLKDDQDEEMVLNTLTDLMSDSASVMQLKLKEALPYATCGAYIEEDGPVDAIVFYAINIDREDAKTFKETVNATLKEIGENGFPQEQVDGIMTSLSISLLLARETTGSDFVDDLLSLPSCYAGTGRPWDYPDYVEALGEMDNWNQQGLYAQAVSKWLIGDDKISTLTLTYPQPGQKELNDQALADKLAEIKAAMTPEEIAKIVEESNKEPEQDDASEYVAQLQAVTVDSLPEEITEYVVKDETDEAGIRHVEAVAGVDGIGQANILLDATGIKQEKLQYFKLFTSLLGELATEKYSYEELESAMSRYFYEFQTNVSLMGTNKEYHPYLRLRWIALDDDLDEGYELMSEILYKTNFDDAQKVLEQVQAAKASLKSSINGAPYNTLLYRALSVSSPLYRLYCHINFVEYYAFLEEVETKLTEDPQPVLDELKALQTYFNNRSGGVSLYAGNETSIAVNRALADAFFAGLDFSEIVPETYEFEAPAKSEALIVDSSVQYNLLICGMEDLGLEEYDAGLDAVTALVTDKLLMPQLRDQYGAYGVWHAAMTEDGMYIISYRDPNVEETFAVYDSLYDQIKKLSVDQDTLNGYILSSYVNYAMSGGELSGAISAAVTVLSGEDSDRYLTWMHELKTVTPEALTRYAELYKNLAENGVRSTAGSASVINEKADLYESILNPFGVEAKKIEWTDVPEDSPYYEAIMDLTTDDILRGISETEFGPDETATVGNMLASLYVLCGGTYDEAGAREAFLAANMIAPRLKIEDPASSNTLFFLLKQLTGGLVYPNAPDQKTMTRAEYAQILWDYLNWLDEQ